MLWRSPGCVVTVVGLRSPLQLFVLVAHSAGGLGCTQDINVKRLCKASTVDTLELLQWLNKFLRSTIWHASLPSPCTTLPIHPAPQLFKPMHPPAPCTVLASCGLFVCCVLQRECRRRAMTPGTGGACLSGGAQRMCPCLHVWWGALIRTHAASSNNHRSVSERDLKHDHHHSSQYVGKSKRIIFFLQRPGNRIL